ncbi:MAG: YjzC family protein [Planctomycetota bacterium]
MSTLASTRLYKTGQICPQSGVWEFVKYTDGTTYPTPTAEEREIPLSKGETFPTVRSAGKGCWRRLVRDA